MFTFFLQRPATLSVKKTNKKNAILIYVFLIQDIGCTRQALLNDNTSYVSVCAMCCRAVQYQHTSKRCKTASKVSTTKDDSRKLTQRLFYCTLVSVYISRHLVQRKRCLLCFVVFFDVRYQRLLLVLLMTSVDVAILHEAEKERIMISTLNQKMWPSFFPKSSRTSGRRWDGGAVRDTTRPEEAVEGFLRITSLWQQAVGRGTNGACGPDSLWLQREKKKKLEKVEMVKCNAPTQVQRSSCLGDWVQTEGRPRVCSLPWCRLSCVPLSMRQSINEGAQDCLGTWLRLGLEWGWGKGLGWGTTTIHESDGWKKNWQIKR